jgi:hypothetical protein
MAESNYQFTGHAGISRLTDNGLVLILRKFTELNARNLFAMQDELQELEQTLEDITKERQIEMAQHEPKDGAGANSMSDSRPEVVLMEEETLLEIRKKLKEYSLSYDFCFSRLIKADTG